MILNRSSSLVLNPLGRHYALLKAKLTSIYQDNYFDQDAIYLERNSRDFKRRARAIDANTEAVCDFLYSHSLDAVDPQHSGAPLIKTVYYPKFTTTEHYMRCRYQGDDDSDNRESAAGYGGLFSLTFTSPSAAKVFFDTLECAKGPSLGTNFTLASPYTILAHYPELDWAEGWGVDRNLVRISIGVEDIKVLLKGMRDALDAADKAVHRK
jgi:cystathionine gamma-synthase